MAPTKYNHVEKSIDIRIIHAIITTNSQVVNMARLGKLWVPEATPKMLCLLTFKDGKDGLRSLYFSLIDYSVAGKE